MMGYDLQCVCCYNKDLEADMCIVDKVMFPMMDFRKKEMLAAPQYKMRKEKKCGTLISPNEVTVLGISVNIVQKELEVYAYA